MRPRAITKRFRGTSALHALLIAVCVTSLLRASGQVRAQTTASTQTLPDAPGASGSVIGTVTDGTGALILGAIITLRSGSTVRTATSAEDGSFALSSIPAGKFDLTVALQGFDPASTEGTVKTGEVLELPAVSLKMAQVDISVNAITQKQLAQLQVHAEEQQRVLGVLPNFFVSYDWDAEPLTPRQKFSLVVTTFRDPVNIFIAASAAGVQQWQNDLPGYGSDAPGYGKRFGANYGNLVIGSTLGGGVFPVLFHQDPRYFYKGTGSVRSRLVYSLSRAVITRGDNGRNQPAFAAVLGDFSAGAISNAYYPATNRSGVGLTIANGLIAIGGDAVSNVFQEFIVRRFTPKSRRGVVNAVTTEASQH